jgi:hypothetical protein
LILIAGSAESDETALGVQTSNNIGESISVYSQLCAGQPDPDQLAAAAGARGATPVTLPQKVIG